MGCISQEVQIKLHFFKNQERRASPRRSRLLFTASSDLAAAEPPPWFFSLLHIDLDQSGVATRPPPCSPLKTLTCVNDVESTKGKVTAAFKKPRLERITWRKQ